MPIRLTMEVFLIVVGVIVCFVALEKVCGGDNHDSDNFPNYNP